MRSETTTPWILPGSLAIIRLGAISVLRSPPVRALFIFTALLTWTAPALAEFAFRGSDALLLTGCLGTPALMPAAICLFVGLGFGASDGDHPGMEPLLPARGTGAPLVALLSIGIALAATLLCTALTIPSALYCLQYTSVTTEAVLTLLLLSAAWSLPVAAFSLFATQSLPPGAARAAAILTSLALFAVPSLVRPMDSPALHPVSFLPSPEIMLPARDLFFGSLGTAAILRSVAAALLLHGAFSLLSVARQRRRLQHP